MTNQPQRRLGRGLEALLGRSFDDSSNTGDEPQGALLQGALPQGDYLPPLGEHLSRDSEGQIWLDVRQIQTNPHQPRRVFDEVEIADLTDSIRAHGVLQPIVIRRFEGGYQLIAGERRLRAAQAAGWDKAPVIFREVGDQQVAEMAIVENLQRKDLNAIEKGLCFQRYMEQYQCTQEELAKRIQVDRSTIANLVRLLELPDEVKELVASGELSSSHAKALLPLGEAEEQVKLARRVKRENLSVRAIEDAVTRQNHQEDPQLNLVDGEGMLHRLETKDPNQHVLMLEVELQTALGCKVSLTQNPKGKGRVTLFFNSEDEFQRLRSQLMGQQGQFRVA